MHQCPQRIIITFLTPLASSNLWASGAQESREVLSLLENQLDTEIQATPNHATQTAALLGSGISGRTVVLGVTKNDEASPAAKLIPASSNK
jgi:hypothetical protein